MNDFSPVAPPTDRDQTPALAAPRSTWPLIFGILCLVFGVFGLLQHGVCAPIGLFAMDSLGGFMRNAGGPAELQAVTFEVMAKYKWASLAVELTAAALSIMLIVGGIGLLARRRWSRGLLLVWAILRPMNLIPALMLQYRINTEQFTRMAEVAASGGNTPAPPMGLMSTMGVAGMLVGGVFVMILPAVTFVWLLLPKIRAEVAEWGNKEAQRFSM